jgi:hypothetical protein
VFNNYTLTADVERLFTVGMKFVMKTAGYIPLDNKQSKHIFE